jgi:beta-lactamase regulating signal transducer with metallopeptidase domain
MNNYLLYLFEVSCVFTVLYAVYFFVFRQLTFHIINRTYLLLSLPLSLIIPILNLSIGNMVITDIELPKFGEIISAEQSAAILNSESNYIFNLFSILLIFYCSGLLIFLGRLVMSFCKLIKTKQRSQATYHKGFCIISANVPSVYSCFNWIFIPRNKISKYKDPIIEHEKIHARLWHTIDLILTELFIALLWFHPFVYFFRKSIKSVHEFQVDSRILQRSTQKSQYLKLMLETLDSNHRLVGLYNYFNGITIKNRVKMITKNKTHELQYVRYLILVPVIALLSMSFSKSGGGKPEIFPISEGLYTKITVQHDQKMVDPFTNQKRIHQGIDIKAEEGVAVLCAGIGIVVKISSEKGWGNLIIVEHGDGFETWYAHLKDFTVEYGQKVEKGHTIGHVGNTGKSTGPHLHYEVRLNGKSLNPMDYVAK